MNNTTSEGVSSAQRINEQIDIEASQRAFMASFEQPQGQGRVIASLESGSNEVNYHAPLVEPIDGSMRALSMAILMAAVICVLVAIAVFAGWVK